MIHTGSIVKLPSRKYWESGNDVLVWLRELVWNGNGGNHASRLLRQQNILKRIPYEVPHPWGCECSLLDTFLEKRHHPGHLRTSQYFAAHVLSSFQEQSGRGTLGYIHANRWKFWQNWTWLFMGRSSIEYCLRLPIVFKQLAQRYRVFLR